MSLNDEQRAQTGRELRALRAALPYTDGALEANLAFRLQDILPMSDMVNPRDVWILRDYLVAAAEKAGIAVPDFTFLRDDMRRSAQGWFGSWQVPPVDNL
ncbi:MAG: DUF2316 family protein [Corynebacterium sp.]|nr:DUF2316 family protein [Corynebacterium sp.]